MFVKCNRCSNVQFASDYKWNNGKIRCNQCGGSVEKSEKKDKNSNTLK